MKKRYFVIFIFFILITLPCTVNAHEMTISFVSQNEESAQKYTDTFSVNLSDIVNAAIGAFFGAFLGIGTTMLLEEKAKKNAIKDSLKNMIKELKDIYDNLDASSSSDTKMKVKDNIDKAVIYDIPIWEAVVKSSYILYFIGKPYYKQLLDVYSEIKYASNIEKNGKDKEIVKARNDLYIKLKNIAELKGEFQEIVK